MTIPANRFPRMLWPLAALAPLACGHGSSSVPLTLGGTIEGLNAPGLALSLQGSYTPETAGIASSATDFTFTSALAQGENYRVEVATQPAGQTCTVENGSGVMGSSPINDLQVVCASEAYAVGGTLTGLVGTALILALNDQTYTVNANGAFVFPGAIPTGAIYTVSVAEQPPDVAQTCTVGMGSGTISNAAVSDVAITCSQVSSYSVGGTVAGLAGMGLVLQLQGQTLPITASGPFTFPTAILSGSDYQVTVSTEPSNPSQTCAVFNGSGRVGNAPVVNVVVSCGNWQSMSAGTSNLLTSVWGTASSDLWVAGLGGTIVHWDSVAWSQQVSSTTSTLTHLWGSGPSDVWAVGFSGALLHWDGSAWRPQTSGTNESLTCIWGSSATEAWAVGTSGTILQWQGATWSSEPSPTTEDILAVWGSSDSDVWAVTDSGTVLHRDGSAWSVSSNGRTRLSGLWGSGPADIWAVGSVGTILHYDGSSWSAVSGGTTDDLIGLWGSSAADVWAVGYAGTILHWDGNSWSGAPSGTVADLTSVWGSGAGDVWAAGAEGTVLELPP